MIPLDRDYVRSLDALPQDCTEVWLFEGPTARRGLERVRGIPVRSAYKTLLHEVLERDLLRGVTEAVIHYPVLDGDEPLRFRLECYPLAEMVATRLEFHPEPQTLEAMPRYRIACAGGNEIEVPVPVRSVAQAGGTIAVAACGWLRMPGADGPFETDYERMFGDVQAALQAVDIPDGRPIFERLVVEVTAPFEDVPLPVGRERLSLAEALHEEIYFSAIEIFQTRLGLAPGARTLRHGQIVPRILRGDAVRLSMRRAPGEADEGLDLGGTPRLAEAGHWLTPAQISNHLDAIGGTAFAATSRQGRPVRAVHVNPDMPGRLAISAGQHANESTPIVGALRAGRALAARGIGFTLSPLENPDGYALFRELCRDDPSHMHHAARYTAGGNDLSFGTGHESAIRSLARDRLAAEVHVNLHGYPSHEWTRPLSGYVPRGFARWTIPKGFFLICRHHPGWGDLAARVLRTAIAAIAGHPAQMRQNAAMMQRYLAAIPEPDFEIAEGCIPHSMTETTAEPYPVALITEAPDETIDGEDFRIAQESQYRVAVAVGEMLSAGTA